MDLQLPVQSVPITTNVVSSNPVHEMTWLKFEITELSNEMTWLKYEITELSNEMTWLMFEITPIDSALF